MGGFRGDWAYHCHRGLISPVLSSTTTSQYQTTNRILAFPYRIQPPPSEKWKPGVTLASNRATTLKARPAHSKRLRYVPGSLSSLEFLADDRIHTRKKLHIATFIPEPENGQPMNVGGGKMSYNTTRSKSRK